MTKKKEAPKKEKKVIGRVEIFADAHKELVAMADNYKTLAIGQEGGTAQRLNKASIEFGRLAKLFV
jgi:hypothetical protein